MSAILFGILASIVVGCMGRHEQFPARTADGVAARAPTWRIALACAAVAGAYLGELFLWQHAALTQRPFLRWFTALPLLVIDDRAPFYGHAPIGSVVALVTLVETAALVWLHLTARGRRLSRAGKLAVVFASLGMIAGSCLWPASTSFDMYAYAGAAHVPNAYDPPALPFDGSFAVLNRIYGVPIFPTPYGPVWLALSRLVLSALPALGPQLLALRLIGALALGACVLALRRLDVEGSTVALVALNPALIAQFVLDGHNDIVAIALVLWGSVLVRRNVPAAITLGILAGNVKLPFLLIAPLIVARAERSAQRIAGAVTIVVGGVALSLATGGHDYVAALAKTTQLYRAFADPAANVIHGSVAVAAAACVGLAVVRRSYLPTAAWAFAGLSATFFGWYLPWGLPYAVLERGWLAAFLVSLPPLTFLLATFYAPSSVRDWAGMLVVVGAPAATYLVLRNARSVKPAVA